MAHLKIKKLLLGVIMTNCYLVYHDQSRQTLIIDPGDRADQIMNTVKEMSLTPCAILLTHGHFDHLLAAEEIKNAYGIPVYAHEEEAEVAADPGLNASGGFGIGSRSLQVDVKVKDGQVLSLAGFEIRVLHTPGHTKGGVCYYFADEKTLFSGDTLFAQSVGRTDLPTGSYSQLIRSIKEKLFVLPEDVQVFPGHDGETSIGYEKKHNPYIV